MLILVLMSSRLVDQEEGVWRPGATRGKQGQPRATGGKDKRGGTMVVDRQGLADLLMTCAIDSH